METHLTISESVMIRQQYELRYFIGYQGPINEEFDHSIIEHASHLCGGCFVSDGTGYWVDGETHAQQFDGPVESEHCLAISLTTEPEKTRMVLDSMQNFISDKVVEHGLPVEWIHVQQHDIIGCHFQVVRPAKPTLKIVSNFSANRGDA